MCRTLTALLLFGAIAIAEGQIQVDLKFRRLQYIAYEPVLATVTITNLAGRGIELRDNGDQAWYGFEITGDGDRLLAPIKRPHEPPLQIAAGTSVTRKIDLTSLFPVQDLGVYHVRTNVFFADLNKFFYAQTKVFEVTSARPIWQRTVGEPTGYGTRTYSLMTNRFPDHTSLYVRVEDRENSLVYATFSLGRVISFDQPHAEIDRENHLHVLHCTAPRVWAYSVIGLDGKLLKREAYSEARTMPRLRRTPDGVVEVGGGMLGNPARAVPLRTEKPLSKISDRPARSTPED
ncbi:MAG TPA: hypothetical protein VGI60_12160 [Chthoniobacterales bacterium]|jgi:hypothetical protein